MRRSKTVMAYAKRKPKYRWRDFLTEEEEARIAEIEQSPRPSPQMRWDWTLIRNRAAQRALRDAARRAT